MFDQQHMLLVALGCACFYMLIQIQNTEQVKECSSLKQIKIIPFKEKSEWELCPKYNIGNTK